MMTKLITETPDHPIPFLIGHLQTKQESPGRLHRTLSGSAALWAESDCSENKSHRRDFRSYDRAWQIHPKKPKKSKSDLAVSNISPPSPESKSLPRSIECPSWDWRTKPESRDFDELNHILRESKKLGKALASLSRSIALSDELDQDPRLYNSVLRPRVVGEWLGRDEDDADPLAAEMLQPPIPRAKNEGWSSRDTSPAGSLKMEVKTKGLKQQQQHRKKLLAAMLSQDSFDSMASSAPSVTEDEIEDEDDAMELLEQFHHKKYSKKRKKVSSKKEKKDLDDLRMEGVTGLVSSGSKFSQGRSSYCPEPQAKVTLNICSRCARLQGDSLAPAGAEEEPAPHVPEQAVPDVTCPLPGVTEPPTAAELELQSSSQVSATVGCELEEKERFWSELDEVMESIPTGERVVIGADFNGHVGEGNRGDEEVMGKFGVKERNLEGQMVVDFAKKMDMAVVNTYFQKREEHRVTYKSGGRRTHVDYILCRRGNLKEISDCKVVVGESVARQHRMVVCRMTLMVCKKKRSKIEIEKKTKWWKLKKEECCEEFRQKLRQALGGQVVLPDDWETTAEVIRETGRKVLGVSSGRRKEDKETWWWNEEVQDSVQRKRLAKKKWDMDRTEENRQEYKELQRRVKREVSKAKQKAYDELYTRLDTREGEKDLYRVLTNLEKAYDRVPREELWYCMRKSGVAEKYVRVVQDMYERSRTVVSESREQVEENLERWRFALERRGMKVSRSKAEYMCVNEREGSGTVRLQGEEVKKVQEFKYLGSTVQSNGECGKERYPGWPSSDVKPVRGTSPQAQRRALQLEELLFSKELENMGKHLAGCLPPASPGICGSLVVKVLDYCSEG
ncbi:hypothetical protein QTP86_026980 [Hemibagrus guttatus]|nr:hypothetical protein QTP86_026980 [Hemibagrus guttatus]